MDNLRNIAEFDGNTLWITKTGFINPGYELTDYASIYGKMVSSGLFSSNHVFYSIQDQATIAGKLWTAVEIQDSAGNVAGATIPQFFHSRTSLWLADGFKANYLKPSFWFNEYVWQNPDTEAELVRITINYGSSATAIINFKQPAVTILHFFLLVFLGIKLSLIIPQTTA